MAVAGVGANPIILTFFGVAGYLDDCRALFLTSRNVTEGRVNKAGILANGNYCQQQFAPLASKRHTYILGFIVGEVVWEVTVFYADKSVAVVNSAIISLSHTPGVASYYPHTA